MKIAKVVANPFAALAIDPSSDDEAKVGIPQGVVALPAARGIWLGARLDEAKLAKTGKHSFFYPLGKDGKPRVIEIQIDDANVRSHIATAILDGSLIAADEKTARVCGFGDSCLPVDKALEAEKAKALESFQALYGKDARIGEVPTKAEESDGPAPPAPSREKAVITKNLVRDNAEGK